MTVTENRSAAQQLDFAEYQEVTALLFEAARLLDDGRYRDWIELFTDDGEYKAMSAENHERGWPLGIIDDIRDSMLDRAEIMEKYWSIEPFRTRRLVSNVVAVPIEEGRVRVESSFLVLVAARDGVAQMQAMGRYEDIVEQSGDRWRFRSRLAIHDNTMLSHNVTMPL
ncbi:MAG: nuclear transport factor 2 family protein [Actinobacteria bacterium]|nr:nuclear transport factor 2 family protein [Actinomycetota bacterium]